MTYRFSKFVPKTTTDPVGDILRVAGQPGVISFAGGLPAPELFPVKQVQAAAQAALAEHGAAALQYGNAQGVPQLLDVISDRIKREQIKAGRENVLVTTGSQQVLDLVTKLFINPGDSVIVEEPTYLCAVDAFKSYGANLVGVEMDDDGIRVDELEQVLKNRDDVKLLYTIPNYQNPTGRSMPAERRQQIAQLAEKYDLIVLEDNPYGEINFTGERIPSIKSYDQSGHVIYTSTFSKILAPGMRVGWLIADEELIPHFTMLKQTVDLHTDNFTQYTIAKFFEQNDVDEHVRQITDLYRSRKDAMIAAMEKYFPADVKFSRPTGGMFLWVEVPGGIDTQTLFDECIANHVAFVPGEPFYPKDAPAGKFRLNFSNTPADQIEVGIQRLAEALVATPVQTRKIKTPC